MMRSLLAIATVATALIHGSPAEAAELTIDATEGAKLRVDDQPVGVFPLPRSVELTPGTYTIEVSLDGHHTHVQQVTVSDEKETTLDIDLEPNTQRTASIVLMSVGGAALAAGVVFGVLATLKHRDERDLVRAAGGVNSLGEEDTARRDDLISARDDFRVLSGSFAAPGLGMLLLGAALYSIDSPSPPKAGWRLQIHHAGANLSFRF